MGRLGARLGPPAVAAPSSPLVLSHTRLHVHPGRVQERAREVAHSLGRLGGRAEAEEGGLAGAPVGRAQHARVRHLPAPGREVLPQTPLIRVAGQVAHEHAGAGRWRSLLVSSQQGGRDGRVRGGGDRHSRWCAHGTGN